MRYFIVFLMILISCNPPRVRNGYYGNNNDIINDGGDSPILGGDDNDNNDNDTGGNTGGNPNIPSGASHCTFASSSSSIYKHSSEFFGKFNICKSKSAETIYLQLASTFYTSAKLCLIPVAKYLSGYIEIGEARCLASSDALKIHEIPIYISRYGYDFTGIMILKDSYYKYAAPYGNPYYNGATYLAPDAFLMCSNALRNNGNYAYCNAFYKNAHHLVTF